MADGRNRMKLGNTDTLVLPCNGDDGTGHQFPLKHGYTYSNVRVIALAGITGIPSVVVTLANNVINGVDSIAITVVESTAVDAMPTITNIYVPPRSVNASLSVTCTDTDMEYVVLLDIKAVTIQNVRGYDFPPIKPI